MGISSVGVGSGILTQDVLDQLRAADEASQIQPIDLSIALENDKKDSLDLIDATMTNLIDSITEIKSHNLYDERSTTVTGTSVEVSASAGTDVQEFNITVGNLATKQIEQSASFSSDTALIATGAGSLNLNVNGTDYTINYDATTTLKDLKSLINTTAGDDVDATVVQISSGDYRLFLSSANTGSSQNITITDTSGLLSDDGGTTPGGTALTSGLTAIQTGVDANFTFNGQAVTRESNEFSDLITGLTVTLKETGSTDVSIEQDREGILEKMDSFVEKYNAAISELEAMTKSSVDSAEKGIFSGESTIKSMKRAIEDMISTVGGGVGTLYDYGFDVDKDGVMTFDSTVFEAALDDNATNVEAFFAGGTYTNDDLTTTELDGAFVDIATIVESYTKYGATLDEYEDSIDATLESLQDRKTSATERLDTKYEILKKQFIAYDLMISKINSASSMFVQLANAQTDASNN